MEKVTTPDEETGSEVKPTEDDLKADEQPPTENKCMKSDCESDGDDVEQNNLQGALVVRKSKISWSDVAGLDSVKGILKEAVTLQTKNPQGILLFGAPGTGKTFVAKALANEVKDTKFFHVSCSDFISKWLGEPEKAIRNLFKNARAQKPSIIFIDDIHCFCSSRTGEMSEIARRAKSKFLNQMQIETSGILVLGATDVPWVLDAEIRKVFEKKIFIPLPNEEARLSMFKLHLKNAANVLSEENMRELAIKTEGYSGADIFVVVRGALMKPFRKLQNATHFKKVRGSSSFVQTKIVDDLVTPCSAVDPGAFETNWLDVDGEKLFEPPVTMADMLNSITQTRPTIYDEELRKLQKFNHDFCRENCTKSEFF